MISSGDKSDGPSTCTVSEAKLTEADTPGSSLSLVSMVFTHEEHVIPLTEKVWANRALF